MPATIHGVIPHRLRRPGTGFRALTALGLATLLSACAAQTGTQTGGTVVRPPSATVAQGPVADVSQPVPVALLLPLTGGDSTAQAIARDMQDAARMAADETAGLGPIDLRLRDSGSNAATASAAASAAKAEGVPIVIGPAFAEEAQAVAGVAQTSGTPVLALSSFADYADPPLYILGLHPGDEVERILGYAASQGMSRIGLVLPQNLYGEVVGSAVDRAAARFGLSIVHRLDYPYTAQGAQQAITDGAPALAAAAPDAVLVPEDNGQVLTWILSFLALGDVRAGQQQFLGLSGWETGDGLRAPELVGGWYAAPDMAALDAFNSRFEARYGRRPSRPAAVAYDAISAVAQMIAQARRSGGSAFSAEALTAQAGFRGATGRFRLQPDGVIARDLAIMEVGPNGPIPRAAAAPAGS